MKLDPEVFLSGNVTRVAKALLGKVLVTKIGGTITSGILLKRKPILKKNGEVMRLKGKPNAMP